MSAILSFIYEQSLAVKGGSSSWSKLKARFFRLLRRWILCFVDPPCQMKVWGRPMWMPFSHELPGCLVRDWHYDQVLQRLAKHIRATKGPICGIDVGANIGDTIAASIQDEQDQFLGIEPSGVFFQCLVRNLGSEPKVRLAKLVCSAKDNRAEYRVATGRGTATFEKSAVGGEFFQTSTLDAIITQFPEFGLCNFLKIDTDGHDFEVLRGSRRLIAAAQPAILFECEMRTNPDYVADGLEAFKFFASVGYRCALVYDNDGELFGFLNLRQPLPLLQMLFYQLTSRKINFDLLLMQDAETFLRTELEFFVNAAASEEARKAAQNAAALIATLSATDG
jgi:FkbM family methyltransferase